MKHRCWAMYQDPTFGGMYYVDGDLGKPSGHKLRGEPERRVIARIERREGEAREGPNRSSKP